jgi:hypothetical protein
VLHIANWYLNTSQNWRVSEILDIDGTISATSLDVVRTSGHAQRRQDVHHGTSESTKSNTVPVVYEINRLHGGRTGPLEERIIEYAASTIPCPLGLHSVDIRRPLSDEDLPPRRKRSEIPVLRNALVELRALRDEVSISWALCSTFGRGPSIAELYHGHGSSIQVGFMYISKSVQLDEISEALHPAHAIDVGSGYEIALTKWFGGPMDAVSPSTYNGLWKVLRKASLSGLSWEILRTLSSTTST